ncbi:MAG: hypothetical protein ACJAYE_001962 [Candidatus Azotimanducaceae bacterium]|jgi:hypothetical protein
MRWIIFALLFVCQPSWAAADDVNSGINPSLFRAVYKADYKGLPISAKGVRELTQDETGRYRLSSKATSIFASITETTEFTIEGSEVIPYEYQYHRSGIGKKRDAILSFDWDSGTVLNDVQDKPWRMDVPTGALDKLLYQFKLREDLKAAYASGQPWPDLEYVIADGGKLKNYAFKVVGEEVIDTPLGKMNTIKAARVKDSRNRESMFWLSLDYDFLLVRFQQLKADGSGFELHLREAEFAGKKL